MQKNQAISLICATDMFDKKILQSDWLKTVWTISLEQQFPKYEICTETQQIR